MSLKISSTEVVPEATFNTAHAAFPKGNPCMTLRDHLGTVFSDEQFADLFPKDGQPALAPWKLALVTVLQFGENLSDRQAAESVRARIDWKYLLGLELTDPGFDFSVLSEFRSRLIDGGAEERLLDLFIEHAKEKGLVKTRGRQRTDATHVLAAVRELNRLELVAESMRAALNEIATIQAEWLQEIAPADWYKRYSRRIEDTRLPKTTTQREAYATTVGEDGFFLLDQIEASVLAVELSELPKVKALRTAWARHYDRDDDLSGGNPVTFRSNAEIKESPVKIESPYDTDARYRTKRDKSWTGYMVHLTETCDEENPHLITHVHTTPADVHDVNATPIVQQALQERELLPKEHLVDSAYIDASLLVSSKEKYGIDLVGPPREYASWQKLEGGYDADMFIVD
jgi:transposase